MSEVVIDRRFCGPPTTANGGYTCGVLAHALDGGPIQVTLRSPPPLGRPLALHPDAGEAKLWDDAGLVAEATRAALDIDVPPAVDFATATRAAEHYEWMHEHPYPTCFVCGPRREEGDGLRIFASPVAGRDVYAAPWVPTADLADADGNVRPEFVWASLDCPSGLVTNTFEDVGRILLGRLTADLRRPVRAESEHVLIAWPIGREGRKIHTGSALYSAAGELLAAARALWIDVEPG